MAYQIKKLQKIVEDIELLNDDNSVALTIHVDIVPENIARKFNVTQVKLVEAQKKVKAKDDSALEEYGEAIIAMFEIVFGEENTAKILEYFEGKYTDMAIQLMPFITNVIQPALRRNAEDKKALIANNYHLNRWQKRKLGL